MSRTIPVFIGYDARETVAYHVLAHSLIRRSSEPLAITPVGNDTLPENIWWRPPGPHDSTAFSNARFAVPALMDYQGWAIFMDCDMVAGDDLAKLWAQRDNRYAVMVRKHEHTPPEATKFLGAPQARYKRKNWSSLMLFNCEHRATKSLTPVTINHREGLALHGFEWCEDEDIGELTGDWNRLCLEGPTANPLATGPLMHFTKGGPWHGVAKEGRLTWADELKRLLIGGNPRGSGSVMIDGTRVAVQVDYRAAADEANATD